MGRGTLFDRRRAWPPVPLEALMPIEPNATRIETDRLVLRVLAERDYDDYAALLADPESFRYSERGPMSGDEAWTRLLRQVGHWALKGYGLFAVEEKATGRFVGEAGLGDFRRRLGEDFDPWPEAAWTIHPAAWGRGYATEAAAAALAWIEGKTGAARSVCLIHAANAPSLRVAAKLGYAPFGERVYRGYPAILHERLRPDFG